MSANRAFKDDAEKLRFVLENVKCTNIEMDWTATHLAGNYSFLTAENIQRRFKSIVEKAGFDMEGGKKVVDKKVAGNTANAGNAVNGEASSSSKARKLAVPRKRKTPATAGVAVEVSKSTKKRKANNVAKGKAPATEGDAEVSQAEEDIEFAAADEDAVATVDENDNI